MSDKAVLEREAIRATWIAPARIGGEQVLIVDRNGSMWVIAPPGSLASWRRDGEHLGYWRLREGDAEAVNITFRQALEIILPCHHNWAFEYQRELIESEALAPGSSPDDPYRARLQREMAQAETL